MTPRPGGRRRRRRRRSGRPRRGRDRVHPQRALLRHLGLADPGGPLGAGPDQRPARAVAPGDRGRVGAVAAHHRCDSSTASGRWASSGAGSPWRPLGLLAAAVGAGGGRRTAHRRRAVHLRRRHRHLGRRDERRGRGGRAHLRTHDHAALPRRLQPRHGARRRRRRPGHLAGRADASPTWRVTVALAFVLVWFGSRAFLPGRARARGRARVAPGAPGRSRGPC